MRNYENAWYNERTSGGDMDDSASIFQKVRLANPKIKAVLVDVAGAIAIDVMMLHEKDGESFLIFPKGRSSVFSFVTQAI